MLTLCKGCKTRCKNENNYLGLLEFLRVAKEIQKFKTILVHRNVPKLKLAFDSYLFLGVCHRSESDHKYSLQVLTLNGESGSDLYNPQPSIQYNLCFCGESARIFFNVNAKHF